MLKEKGADSTSANSPDIVRTGAMAAMSGVTLLFRANEVARSSAPRMRVNTLWSYGRHDDVASSHPPTDCLLPSESSCVATQDYLACVRHEER